MGRWWHLKGLVIVVALLRDSRKEFLVEDLDLVRLVNRITGNIDAGSDHEVDIPAG